MPPLTLALSHLRVHKMRALLTISAIALSVSLVIAVTSGYASLYAAAHKMLTLYTGTMDFEITRRNDLHGGVSSDLIAQLRADPDVEQADGRLEIEGRLLTAAGANVPGRVNIIGIQRPDDTRVLNLRLEQGRWFDVPYSHEAVVDEVGFERLEKPKLGSIFFLPLVDRQLKLQLAGVVHKPRLLAAAIQTVYVPLETLQKFVWPDNPKQVSRIMIDLVGRADTPAFESRWRTKLQAVDPNLFLRAASASHKAMDDNLQGLHGMSYLGSTVSMLAATFIIFSALSMGVAERQRTLAMLRAIGAFRAQIGNLVIIEGLLLAVAGVIVGIPLGIAWIGLIAWRFAWLFNAGATISHGGILFAAVGSLVTALAASLLPALSAMRASPLDAMSPLAQPPGNRGILGCALVGLLLMCIDPLILFSNWLGRDAQFYAHFTIGLSGIMIGFFLVSPTVVKFIESVLGPVVGAILGLRFALLKQQLSGGVWRAAGTCAALMVGLAILIVTQTQGTSAIQGWKLPDKFPDIFIYSFAGLNEADGQKLKQVSGIHADEFMPVAIASPQFGSNIFALAGTAFLPDATMFFGVDPDKAFSMMELDFRDGNAEQARQLLKKGGHVIVTQEFRQLRGLGVGDKIPLKTSKGTVDFTIAGVVWSPGIDVIASLYDLGQQLSQRTGASVFGTIEDAREYFGVQNYHLFAANIDKGLEKDKLMSLIQYQFGRMGLDAGDVRAIKATIQRTFTELLMLVSSVAYAAMAVASLGVTNTIMASIRTRRWHFGILRSIGVTRSQLLRLVLAEAILLGLIGVALGMAAGFELAINERQGGGRFVGYQPPMVVPWTAIAIGIGAIMSVSVLASLWPAIDVARTEPLSLLQPGRASM